MGITHFAQDQLGDIVYFELPKVGDTVTHLGKMGEVESVKAVSDLYSPVSGEVIEVNGALTDQPELTNSDPFGEGWLIRVTMSDMSELDYADCLRKNTTPTCGRAALMSFGQRRQRQRKRALPVPLHSRTRRPSRRGCWPRWVHLVD